MFQEKKVVFATFNDFRRFQEGTQSAVKCEVLNDKNMVDFSRPSYKRQHLVVVQGQNFFVNLQEISDASIELSYPLKFGVFNELTPTNFQQLLHAICPSINGLVKEEISEENIITLLSLTFQFHVLPILDDCEKLILSKRASEFSVNKLFDVYQVLHQNEEQDDTTSEYPMKTFILKAILEHKDQEMVSHYLRSNYNAVPFVIEAHQRQENTDSNFLLIEFTGERDRIPPTP